MIGLVVAIGPVSMAAITPANDRSWCAVFETTESRQSAKRWTVFRRRFAWRKLMQGRCQDALGRRPITICVYGASCVGKCRGDPVPHGRGSEARASAGDRWASAGIAISRALVR